MTEQSVFTTEEVVEYTSTQVLRKKLLNELSSKDYSSLSTSDKVLLASLLDGSDKSTFTRAKIRNDKSDAENQQSLIKLAAETLKSINTKTYRPEASAQDRTVPESVTTRPFVPGETEITTNPI